MIALDHASRKDASESWDDDFEFQSNAPSPSTENPVVISSVAPQEQESWDDAYDDEDGGVQADVVPARDSDADTVSWGSDSDWSGDGDAEDVSHESYTNASLGLPEPQSPSRPTAPTHDSTPHSPSSASFFSRISPVKKWRVRDRGDAVACGKGVGSDTRSTPLKSTPRWTRKRSSTNPAEVIDSSRHVTLRNETLPTTPLTPDLTFSLSNPPSPVTTPPPRVSSRLVSDGKSRRSKSNMLVPAPTPMPFVTSSTHNLQTTAEKQASPMSPRRSSLGDLKRPGQLKIPDRISRAQHDIKRDMGDVKEFAACIEQLRNLQHIYTILVRDLRTSLSPPPSASPSPKKPRRRTVAGSPVSSPTKSKPLARKFSFIAASSPEPEPLLHLHATYGVWWECAELLILLGGRTDADAEDHREFGPRGRRPRAVTLGSGSDVAPPSITPPRAPYRATTGRAGPRDFTPRQLLLLRGMLHAEAGKGWDPRNAVSMASSAKLGSSVRGKARAGGLGIRDLWRGLRKASGAPSSSGESSASEGPCLHASSPPPSPSKRTVTAANNTVVLSRHKQPTRRPSLAGIFGLGQRAVSARVDRADSGEDNPPSGTIRGAVKRPAASLFAEHESSPTASPPSARARESSFAKKKTTPPRLRGVADSDPSLSPASPKRPRLFSPSPARTPALTPNLALTPENIRPLLGHARDIGARLNECLGEVRALMGSTAFQ